MSLQLDAPADALLDPIDTPDSAIRAWARECLPPPSASAFTDWLFDEVGDWGWTSDATARDVLISAYRHWIGSDYPDPY